MNVKESLMALLKVKSIVTIILTCVFAYLAIIGRITGEQFLVIFSTVITFYFTSQTNKNSQPEVVERETVIVKDSADEYVD